MDKKLWKRDLLLSILVPGALLLIALMTIRFSYEVNDDTAMISIMNGSYTGTPSPYAIFIKYPLAWLISLLYRTGIAVSWYQITMFAIMWLAIGSILYRLLKRLPEQPVLACAIVVGSVSVLWMVNIMRFTYSTCGAFLASSALICFALQKKEEDLRPGYLVNIIALYVLAYLLRDYFCYIATCFLAVIWFCKYGREMFSNRKCWRIPVTAVLSMGIAMGINAAAYNVNNWDWFIDYNNARSNLQDILGFPEYNEHEEMITELGYDQREYYTVSHYDYCLLEDFDPNDLFALNDYANEQIPDVGLVKTLKNTVKQAIDYYFVDSWKDVQPLQFMSYLLPVLLLVLTVICALRDRKWWYLLCNGIIMLGIVGIWLVIAYQGRYPIRVAATMRILTVAASLSGILLLYVDRPKKESAAEQAPWKRLAVGALAGIFAVLTLAGLVSARQERGAPTEAISMEYISYAAEHPENIYLRDTRSTLNNVNHFYEYPLTPVNLIATGSWTAYSPIYYEKLAAVGLEELNRETLYLDNCYLIVNEKYNLPKVLGVSNDAVIDYEVTETFDNGIRILKIHSVSE